MKIDFKKLKASGQKVMADVNKPKVQALLMGKRGSRKSGKGIFSWGKMSVLALIGDSEKHGLGAEKYHPNSNVTPVKFDCSLENQDVKLGSAEDVLNQLSALLAEAKKSEFEVIVIDGLSVIDEYVQKLKKVVNANGFEKPGKIQETYLMIKDLLLELTATDKHVVVTLATSGYESGGTYFEKPELRGKQGLQTISGAFGDILPIQIRNGEAVFCFDTSVHKKSTKMDKTTELVDVEPRVQGLDISGVDVAPANFEKLLAAKAKGAK